MMQFALFVRCLLLSAAAGRSPKGPTAQGCQMAKFDPFLSLDCARVEGVGDQILQRSVAEP